MPLPDASSSQIGVLGARNLVGKAGRGLSNPYCTVWVTMTNNRQMKEKTQVKTQHIPRVDSSQMLPTTQHGTKGHQKTSI